MTSPETRSTRFTFDPATDFLPVWSPDSSRIFFSSFRGGGGLYEKDASGATEEKLLLKATPEEQLYPWFLRRTASALLGARPEGK